MEGDTITANCPGDDEISIHALRVEGDLISFADRLGKIDISIHALRVEGDIGAIIMDMPALQFLSTPSGWRATFSYGLTPVSFRISIHALRVEGD